MTVSHLLGFTYGFQYLFPGLTKATKIVIKLTFER